MNEVLLDLGFIRIYWYSFMLFLAFLIGGSLAIREAKKYKIEENFMINMFFYLIIFSMIGARAYYVLFNLENYDSFLSIFKVWEGGLAIHGGIICGSLVILLYSKKYKVSTMRLLDILVVSLILGQAIGRWGNFFNHEAYGVATSLSTLQAWHLPEFIIDNMFINGTYYTPTFLIESIWCILGFILLLIYRNKKYTKVGQTTCLYMVWYGVGRFFIEWLRMDSLMLGNFRVAQIVSILMVILGIIFFRIIGKGSVFSNNYNDRSNANETTF